MSEPRTDLLLALADLLESPKVRRHFDLTFLTNGDGATPFDCGSTACAIGLLPAIDKTNTWGWVRRRAENDEGKWGLELTYQGRTWFDPYQHAGTYLGIEHPRYLFDPSYYPETHKSARYVANRIRVYVRQGCKPPLRTWGFAR